MSSDRGTLIVLSGPSGVGKSTLCTRLLELPATIRSISATSRDPRPGEQDGVDYIFLTREVFEEWIAREEFIEHAEIYGNLYGTPATSIREAVEAGQYPVLDLDPQGVEQLRRLEIDAVYIFVSPPSLEELRRRIESRGKDDAATIERRLKAAEAEMARIDLYDWELVNDDLDETHRKLVKYLADHIFDSGRNSDVG
jgi:guanylate kinase